MLFFAGIMCSALVAMNEEQKKEGLPPAGLSFEELKKFVKVKKNGDMFFDTALINNAVQNYITNFFKTCNKSKDKLQERLNNNNDDVAIPYKVDQAFETKKQAFSFLCYELFKIKKVLKPYPLGGFLFGMIVLNKFYNNCVTWDKIDKELDFDITKKCGYQYDFSTSNFLCGNWDFVDTMMLPYSLFVLRDFKKGEEQRNQIEKKVTEILENYFNACGADSLEKKDYSFYACLFSSSTYQLAQLKHLKKTSKYRINFLVAFARACNKVMEKYPQYKNAANFLFEEGMDLCFVPMKNDLSPIIDIPEDIDKVLKYFSETHDRNAPSIFDSKEHPTIVVYIPNSIPEEHPMSAQFSISNDDDNNDDSEDDGKDAEFLDPYGIIPF